MAKIADLNLKPCYVSLSQTCKDLKLYDKAISYFKEELLLCQSPKDVSSDCSLMLLTRSVRCDLTRGHINPCFPPPHRTKRVKISW